MGSKSLSELSRRELLENYLKSVCLSLCLSRVALLLILLLVSAECASESPTVFVLGFHGVLSAFLPLSSLNKRHL